MNRCVVQAYDVNHIYLAEATIPLMAKWCHKHGWSHKVFKSPISEDHDHNYRKYPVVRSCLNEDNEVVDWADTDIVPVSGEDLKLSQDHADIHISLDRHGYCAGMMVYYNSQWTRDFVAGLTAIIPKHGIYRTHEQDCLKRLLLIGQAQGQTRTIPETVVACPQSPETIKPTFYHLWANLGWESALTRLGEIKAKYEL